MRSKHWQWLVGILLLLALWLGSLYGAFRFGDTAATWACLSNASAGHKAHVLILEHVLRTLPDTQANRPAIAKLTLLKERSNDLFFNGEAYAREVYEEVSRTPVPSSTPQ